MAKIAFVILVNNKAVETPAEVLEQELRQILGHNDMITTKWSVEKITITDDPCSG